MNKEELHKAAEEWLKEKGYIKTMPGALLSGLLKSVVESHADFYLHQTKKMLERWTDERIEEFLESREEPHMKVSIIAFAAIKIFRDELLKQLEG